MFAKAQYNKRNFYDIFNLSQHFKNEKIKYIFIYSQIFYQELQHRNKFEFESDVDEQKMSFRFLWEYLN